MLSIRVFVGVVYVDGIPIESTLLEAGESGLKGEEKNDPTSLAALDPQALFDKYDTDGSGDIDFEEFKVLLHDLSVNLTEPKARAYFRRCDRRRRGCISFDEFRLALYTCDPKNPDRTGGFAPGQSLAPKDLFEMFDKEEEGAVDRAAFMELLEFIGRKMPLDKIEDLFATYEDLEMLSYLQFKKAWLSVVDVQAELRQRGEKFNRFLPPKMLAKKLAMLVSLEEKQEALTLLEANNTLSDEMIATQRRELVTEARCLARVTLAEALDAAGHVYVFGKGAYQRFDCEPKEPDFVDFMDYNIVRELWQQRVCPSTGSGPNTANLRLLESHEIHDKLGLRQKYAKVFEKPVPLTLTDEDRRRRLQLVGQYYGLLNPVPGKSTVRSLNDLMETVEPDLDVDNLSLSLFVRGVEMAKPTRMALLETLGECLELERECVGEKFHEHMKQQDQIARRHRKERREKAMMSVVVKANALWFELNELREKMATAERERLIKGDEEYDKMKRKITHATQKLKRRAREGHSAMIVADSNSNNKTDKDLLYINGLTARGPASRFFNGSQALQSIAVGSRHAVAIHSSGKLYSWGVGSFGRLGGAQNPEYNGDRSNNDHNEGVPVDSWHRDAHTAQSSAFYRWNCVRLGSATHGKLGIGPVQVKESFTLAPLALSSLTSLGVRVRKIACGPSHSALLTVDGALFVWGCGDGGRLGLGDGRDIGEDRIPRNGGRLRVISSPTHVAVPFEQEKLVEVACGAAHTVVLSAIQRTSRGPSGGCVYVAGSNHALEKLTPQFTRVTIEEASSMVMITKVSCGSAHTAFVSTEGELYTWGKNVSGSTGHDVNLPLISQPTRVGCMFERPRNLCLDEAASATQSSQNASALAEYALGGDHAREAQKKRQTRRASGQDQNTTTKFAQTQHEMCPFWQVKLAERSRIVSIRIVLVSSSSSDMDFARSTAFKYAVMVSEDAFDPEPRGKQALAKARGHSVHVSLSCSTQNELIWTAPTDTFGRFIRVQLESFSGASMLALERVEVLGASSDQYVGPRVSDVVCAEGMTVAICMPLSGKEELRNRFRRAVRADRASVSVLSQLETFQPFVREEEQQAQEDEALYKACQRAKTSIEKREIATAIAELEAKHRAETCVLCRPKVPCVICEVEKQVRAAKQKLSTAQASVTPQQPTRSMNDRRKQHSQPSSSIAPVTTSKRPELALTLEGLCTEFLALDIRSKTEEEEAQKRVELELMDPAALARAKEEEEAAARLASGQLIASHVTSNMRQLLFKMLTSRGMLRHKKTEQTKKLTQ
ncbi:EF-Hand 1, calcium-binding site [Phytophthora cactorum]|nr:EF-Hand 1, calcium-binding site [Phytophthora cactorum]